MKFRHLLFSILICSAIVFFPGAFSPFSGTEATDKYDFVYAAVKTTDDDIHQSSFEFKRYADHSRYLNVLRFRMKNVYQLLGSSISEKRTIPIPGLVETYTVKDGKEKSSDQFVPQGLCRVDKYMLATAYDEKRESNSVIYAVDMTTMTLVSTLTLPNKYHVGGIAFDGSNIWITGDTSDKYTGEPFVQYMKYDRFLELIEKPLNEASVRDLSDRIYIKNKPSFLEYDNEMLWVGTYAGSKGTAEGYMHGYRIVRKEDDTSLNTMMYAVVKGIDSSAQGADIDGDSLYVSSSYNGLVPVAKTSFITRYNLGSTNVMTDINVSGREISRIEVPKMNEEIFVYGNTIHINFESASEHWKAAVVNTDRILAVSKTVWR